MGLADFFAATGSGPAVEPVAAAVARLITAATASDVCFVHVLDDSGGSLTLAGYWFGNIPWIQQNLTVVILAIIGISSIHLLQTFALSRRRGHGEIPDL